MKIRTLIITLPLLMACNSQEADQNNDFSETENESMANEKNRDSLQLVNLPADSVEVQIEEVLDTEVDVLENKKHIETNDNGFDIRKADVQQLEANESFNVVFEIWHYSPYCGGAQPHPETLASLNHLMSNTTYILIDKKRGKQTNVKTDSLGKLSLRIPKGKYAIRETYKDISFEAFYELYYVEPNEYYVADGDKDCYKKWWASSLHDFEVSNTNTLLEQKIETSSSCFSGRNPCVIYRGPYPP